MCSKYQRLVNALTENVEETPIIYRKNKWMVIIMFLSMIVCLYEPISFFVEGLNFAFVSFVLFFCITRKSLKIIHIRRGHSGSYPLRPSIGLTLALNCQASEIAGHGQPSNASGSLLLLQSRQLR